MTLLMFSLNTGRRVCWLDEICVTISGIGAVDVDANDFATGHHDVVDRYRFEIDDSQQHVLAAFRNSRAFAQHRAQFVHVQVIVARAGRWLCRNGRSTKLLMPLTSTTNG